MDGLKLQVGESAFEVCLVSHSMSYHIRCIMQVCHYHFPSWYDPITPTLQWGGWEEVEGMG